MFTLTHIVIALLVIGIIVIFQLVKKIMAQKKLLVNNREMWIKIRNDRDSVREECLNIKSKMINEALFQSLSIIDKTHTTYTNEDEANRELTSCLNAMGHSAVYHQTLDNGRTADILVDGFAIVEGKLDPNPTDIDRLIGQVEDYLTTDSPIYIVVYGNISGDLLYRINNHITKYPEQVHLIYLNSAYRTRNDKFARNFASAYGK